MYLSTLATDHNMLSQSIKVINVHFLKMKSNLEDTLQAESL